MLSNFVFRYIRAVQMLMLSWDSNRLPTNYWHSKRFSFPQKIILRTVPLMRKSSQCTMSANRCNFCVSVRTCFCPSLQGTAIRWRTQLPKSMYGAQMWANSAWNQRQPPYWNRLYCKLLAMKMCRWSILVKRQSFCIRAINVNCCCTISIRFAKYLRQNIGWLPVYR